MLRRFRGGSFVPGTPAGFCCSDGTEVLPASCCPYGSNSPHAVGSARLGRPVERTAANVHDERVPVGGIGIRRLR